MNETTQSWWFVFYKDQLLLEKKENGAFALPYGEIPPITIKEEFYKLKYCSTVVYMVPRA